VLVRFLQKYLLIGAAVMSVLPSQHSNDDGNEDQEYDEVEGGAWVQ